VRDGNVPLLSLALTSVGARGAVFILSRVWLKDKRRRYTSCYVLCWHVTARVGAERPLVSRKPFLWDQNLETA